MFKFINVPKGLDTLLFYPINSGFVSKKVLTYLSTLYQTQRKLDAQIFKMAAIKAVIHAFKILVITII